MTTTILIIDDSEDDRLLYRRVFREGEYELVAAATALEALACVDSVNPDLILLDYNLPDYDGLSVMKMLAAYSPRPIPIIMLTGESDATVAVEAMKNGVDDYMVKDTGGKYLRLLPGVVVHVMAAHAQREETRLLRQQTEALLLRNQALMQNSMDGIHIMDVEGNFVEINDAFCRMLGYTQKEMARLNVSDIDAQWSPEEMRARFKQFLGMSAKFDTVHRRKDGTLLNVEISCSWKEVEGQHFLFAASRDITERVRTEAVMRQHKLVLDTSIDGFWMTDMQGYLLEANEAYAKMSGYTIGQLVGMHISQLEAIEQRPEDVQAHVAKVIAQGSDRFETRHRRKDGHEIEIEVAVTHLADAQRLVIFCRDISERKQAEAKLQKSEANLRAMLDNSPYLTWLKDTEGRYITINKVFSGYLHLKDPALAIGKTDLDLQPQELAEKYRADDAEVMASRQQKHVEESAFDGHTIHWVETFKTPIVDQQDRVLGTVGFARDITERKRAEEMLRESEASLKELFENLKSGVAVYRASSDGQDFFFTSFNRAAERIENVKREDLIGKNVAEVFPGVIEFGLLEVLRRVWQSGVEERFPISFYQGGRIAGWRENYVYKLPNGEVVAIYDDLTREKQAEEQILRKSEVDYRRAEELAEQFGHLLHSSFNEIYMFDADSLVFILTSEGAERNLGYSDKELNQLTPLDLNPEYTRESFESLVAPLRSGEQQTLLFDTSHQRKDGTIYPVEVRLQLMQAEMPIFLAVVQDITERKAAEERLRFHSTILRNLAEGIQLTRASDGVIVFANPQFERLFGYESGELVGQHVSIINAPSEHAPRELADAIMDQLAREGRWSGEVHNIRKDGTLFWSHANVSSFEHSEFGKVWISVHEDITERKQRDQVLQRFESIVDSTDDAIISLSLGGIIQSWNQGAERIFGYTTTEVVGNSIAILVPSAQLSELAEIFSRLSRGEMISHLETVHQRKDGKLIHISATISPIFGAQGRVVGISEIARDISERKHAEQLARELSAHLQTVREEEKASFAREIHDDLGGTLAALKMDAHWLSGKLAAEKQLEPLQECAKSMAGLLDTAVLATRRIITELRPTLLDDLGLLEALKWQSAQFHRRTGIECRVVCGHTDEDIDCDERQDEKLSINLFRIFQESLTNVARHSGASHVKVEFRPGAEEVILSISDNGCGLPEGHTIASTSYGMRGMRERVMQLGGEITFDSPPGGGFRVMVRLPQPAAGEQ